MLERLERETVEHHGTAEEDLFRILDDPTPDGFRYFLAAAYRLEAAIVARLAAVADLPAQVLAKRAKTDVLLADLIAIGSDRTVLELLVRPLEVPTITTLPQALGWIYVLQRGTLQHHTLYRVLAPRLRSTLRLASCYLTAHARDVYERWDELGTHLDRVTLDEDSAQQVISAAHAAFACQHAWCVEARAATAVVRGPAARVTRSTAHGF
jgi:heme oxygenase